MHAILCIVLIARVLNKPLSRPLANLLAYRLLTLVASTYVRYIYVVTLSNRQADTLALSWSK